jgi:hypothetical protein
MLESVVLEGLTKGTLGFFIGTLPYSLGVYVLVVSAIMVSVGSIQDKYLRKTS